jgi:cell division protein FtsI (penicillin-binding protein 3)
MYKRLTLVAIFVFFLFSALIWQFFKVQIIEGEKWTKQALAQHQMLVKDPFKRGLFYSNVEIKEGHPQTPQPFVIDIAKFHLYIDPLAIPKKDHAEIITYLSEAFDEGVEKLPDHFAKHSHSRKLFSWLDRDKMLEVQSWWLKFAKERKIPHNSLYFIEDYQRSYPFGKLLGQVLHTVREERDLQQQSIPTGGLELSCNEYLKGKEGKRLLLRSPRHRLDAANVIEKPEDGADIYLTINHCLQAIVEEALERGVKKSGAKGGWAVMIDPFTGHVFALAQYPFFNPAHYRDYFNDEKLIEETKVKAISDSFEPGSIFKPLALTICLKANKELIKRGRPPIFSPNDKIATDDGKFPGRSKLIKDGRRHRFLNMAMAVQKSSNIYPSRLIQKVVDELGPEWVVNALQETFGLSLKTGIELPSEAYGMLPRPGKKHPNGALEWSLPTPYSIVMGHNILVTSLQMAKAYSIIANGGFDIKPTLIRKIVKKRSDGSEEILLDNTDLTKVKPCRRVLDHDIVQEMTKALKYTTKAGGTGPRGDVYGYTDAGKSGTSEKIVNGQYSDCQYISSFAGFTPVKDARFVLVISVDEPKAGWIDGIGKNHHGGNCASPIFSEIATRSLRYLGVLPDDPHGYPPGDPRYDSKKADWIEEVKRLKELYVEWNGE